MESVATPFDSLAVNYDALWSNTALGIAQRRAVWEQLDSCFAVCDLILDAGCGTGVDAEHLRGLGKTVIAIDKSSDMVRQARGRGIDAHCLAIESIDEIDVQFDGVLANFGVLNCVRSMDMVAASLAEKVRRGGFVAVCVFGRVCAWEIVYYLLRANARKAFRRLRGRAATSFGAEAFYPSAAAIERAFGRDFCLLKKTGIGLFVPPSYARSLPVRIVEIAAGLDRYVAGWPLLRSLADHQLFVFQRL